MDKHSIDFDGTADTVVVERGTIQDGIIRDAKSFTRILTAEEMQQLANGPVLDLTGYNHGTICDR